MRTTTMWALLVAGSLAAVAGARAEDAAPSRRASILLPAGDRVHGYLRGGETHVLQVHLAKGDVYSFNVAAPGADDRLLIVMSLRDPSGREVNGEARVKHVAHGKRVSVGPYRVPQTGTYEVQLNGDGPYEGDYWATSKARAGRASYALPTGGTPIVVPVSAGSVMKLRAKKGVPTLTMSLPQQEANDFPDTDELVAVLRADGLTSSATGDYGFAAPGSPGAVSLQVKRPNWKPNSLEFPTLPAPKKDEPSLEWVANQWKPLPVDPVASLAAQAPSAQLAQRFLPSDGPFKSVGGSAANGIRPVMFVASDMNCAGSAIPDIINAVDSPASLTPISVVTRTPPAQPPTGFEPPVPPLPPVYPNTPPAASPAPVIPPVAPPSSAPPATPPGTPPATTPPGWSAPIPTGGPMTSINWRPFVPSMACSTALGTSMMFGNGGLREGPWSVRPNLYPALPRVLASGFYGYSVPELSNDVNGPFSRRVFTYRAGGTDTGSIVTIARYFVDGHPAGVVLATEGDTTVQWSVLGLGTIGGAPWKLEGAWTSVIHSSVVPGSFVNARQCTLSGEERFTMGDITESVVAPDLTLSFTRFFRWDVAGTITNTLSIPSIGLRQTEVRELHPAVVVTNLNRTKIIDVTLTTIDENTRTEDDQATETINKQELQTYEVGYDSCG